MKTYKDVNEDIRKWKASGISKSDVVVNAANACVGWPYVYGGRGENCTPANRRSRANSDYPSIIDKCQVLNQSKGTCSGCRWYPGGTTLFFDCRGFTYWLFNLVDIRIDGRGATSQYDNDNNWSEKGPIQNMPKDQVCCVFRYDPSTKKMEHTLLYDGKGNYIHCSGEVKKVPVSQYKATHYAIPKGLSKGGNSPMPETGTTATVYAENGKPVKMRAKPNTGCATYWEIKVGTEVDVIKAGDEWTNISNGQNTGYMMTKFLRFNEGTEEEIPPDNNCSVTIPGLTLDAARELVSKYPGAYITAG